MRSFCKYFLACLLLVTVGCSEDALQEDRLDSKDRDSDKIRSVGVEKDTNSAETEVLSDKVSFPADMTGAYLTFELPSETDPKLVNIDILEGAAKVQSKYKYLGKSNENHLFEVFGYPVEKPFDIIVTTTKKEEVDGLLEDVPLGTRIEGVTVTQKQAEEGYSLGLLQLYQLGSISGKVTLASDSVVDYGDIIVSIPGTSYLAITDDLGNYRIHPFIPKNKSTITFSRGGFVSQSLIDVEIGPGENRILDEVSLELDLGKDVRVTAIKEIFRTNTISFKVEGEAGVLIYRTTINDKEASRWQTYTGSMILVEVDAPEGMNQVGFEFASESGLIFGHQEVTFELDTTVATFQRNYENVNSGISFKINPSEVNSIVAFRYGIDTEDVKSSEWIALSPDSFKTGASPGTKFIDHKLSEGLKDSEVLLQFKDKFERFSEIK